MNKQTTYRPSTLEYIIGSFISLIKNALPIRANGKPVIDVGKYHLLLEISKKGRKNFFIGVYAHKNKKVFIKTWRGEIKDINYYLLVNEYYTTRILTEKNKEISLKNNIFFPKILGFQKTRNSYSVIYEYIDGKPLSQITSDKQVPILHECLHTLQSISEHLTKQESKQFEKRTTVFYFISLQVITSFVLLWHKEYRKIIIQVFIHCLKSLPVYNKKLMLAHRDLNPNNILIAKGKAYLLDCERVVLTLPNFDVQHMLIAKANKNIRYKLKKKFQSINSVTNSFLLRYICLHYIFSTNHDRQAKQYYLTQLTKLK